jgi:hypothetical protein
MSRWEWLPTMADVVSWPVPTTRVVAHGTSSCLAPDSAQKADDSTQTRDSPCPGLNSQDGVERKAEIAALLKMAEENGAGAREPLWFVYFH